MDLSFDLSYDKVFLKDLANYMVHRLLEGVAIPVSTKVLQLHDIAVVTITEGLRTCH